jgi:hypothetical protein
LGEASQASIARFQRSCTFIIDQGMKKTVEVINNMQAAGVIARYAIGGAIGALNYLEAMTTQDIDIFVSLAASKSQLIATFQPIYDYLKSSGYAFKA